MKGILIKEWRLMRANTLLFLVPLLVFAAVFFALRSGEKWRQTRAETVQAFEKDDAKSREKLLAVARTKFEDYMVDGYYAGYRGAIHAALPPGPLAALARGTAESRPNVEFVGLFPDQAMKASDAGGNPAFARTGGFDLAFVIVFLLPLALIALLHDALAGEREGGRLALTLSQPTSAGRLLTGMVLARAGIVIVPLLVAIIGLVPKAPGWAMVVWVTGAYALFWTALCAFVVSRARSAGASAVALGLLWAVLVVVAPAAVSSIARARHPVPAPFEASAVRNETNDRLHEHWATNNEIFRALYTDRPELIPATVTVSKDRIIDRSGKLPREMRVGTAISYAMVKAAAPFEEKARRETETQDRFAARWGSLFPPTAAADAIAALAGNGSERHAEFVRQTARFRRSWEEFYFRFLFQGARMTVADYERLPVFTFREPEPPVPLVATTLCIGWAVVLSLFAALRLPGFHPSNDL